VHKNIVLIGHKCDLTESRRITAEQGKALADENGWLFFETSAKENINVTETFLAAARIGLCEVQRKDTGS
jgi:Ras-related protein Rab-8A